MNEETDAALMRAGHQIEQLQRENERLRARAEAAEKDAARYRWLLSWLVQVGLLRAEFCQPEAGMKAGDYWVFHRPAVIDGSSCLGYAKSEDAAIDAAIAAEPITAA